VRGRSKQSEIALSRPSFVGATKAGETRAERPEHVDYGPRQRAGALQAAQSLPGQPQNAQNDPSCLDELKIRLMWNECVG